jgi:hypothetical protein
MFVNALCPNVKVFCLEARERRVNTVQTECSCDVFLMARNHQNAIKLLPFVLMQNSCVVGLWVFSQSAYRWTAEENICFGGSISECVLPCRDGHCGNMLAACRLLRESKECTCFLRKEFGAGTPNRNQQSHAIITWQPSISLPHCSSSLLFAFSLSSLHLFSLSLFKSHLISLNDCHEHDQRRRQQGIPCFSPPLVAAHAQSAQSQIQRKQVLRSFQQPFRCRISDKNVEGKQQIPTFLHISADADGTFLLLPGFLLSAVPLFLILS